MLLSKNYFNNNKMLLSSNPHNTNVDTLFCPANSVSNLFRFGFIELEIYLDILNKIELN